MKTYQTLIPDSEAMSKTLTALFEVGFEWRNKVSQNFRPETPTLLTLNVWGPGLMTHLNSPGHSSIKEIPAGTMVLKWEHIVLNAETLEGPSKDPLKGKTMEEWLANEDKVVFKDMPAIVKAEFSFLHQEGRKFEWHSSQKRWIKPVSTPLFTVNSTITCAYRLIPEKKPWETPPEGYRLVTEQEIQDNPLFRCDKWWGKGIRFWSTEGSKYRLNAPHAKAFAVPEDFVFPPKGYRLLTDAERKTLTVPSSKDEVNIKCVYKRDAKARWLGIISARRPTSNSSMDRWVSTFHYAIREDWKPETLTVRCNGQDINISAE